MQDSLPRVSRGVVVEGNVRRHSGDDCAEFRGMWQANSGGESLAPLLGLSELVSLNLVHPSLDSDAALGAFLQPTGCP
jgi:hypothetical protein